ncbi:aminoglycoside phosphotransferase family protein [Arsenicicoccus sp. oral taxon 190]|uniref:aminoglycoside phosphotransferase family protein n=1 Tax=Arsenicicoccus sp. oral taxon 190 TaxID=1658671 RepID=UPI0009E5B373|nr:aminoglycoside phosphotransferase family protein [Arsenicicoccus sp. oral taxon 190]
MPDDLVPTSLADLVTGRPAEPGPGLGVDGDTWLRRLPVHVAELLDRWDLRPDGAPLHGVCALVLPVARQGEPAMLKVTWPHEEARHEHLALRAWAGRGAVRLLAADPSRWAVLLERLDPDRDLSSLPVLDACETAGALHAALDRPALPMLGTASAWCGRIGARLAQSPPPVPPRFVDQGRRLAADLAADPQVDARLVHADLHYGNALAADRPGAVSGWLAIDPKPIAGEPALAVAPLLHNRWDEAVRAYSLRNHLRFRVDYACEPAGVDPARARAWTILRELDDAWWAAREPDGGERVTQAVAIIKAMQG